MSTYGTGGEQLAQRRIRCLFTRIGSPAVADGGYNNDRARANLGVVDAFINTATPKYGVRHVALPDTAVGAHRCACPHGRSAVFEMTIPSICAQMCAKQRRTATGAAAKARQLADRRQEGTPRQVNQRRKGRLGG